MSANEEVGEYPDLGAASSAISVGYSADSFA
jgi:hypothetical protein